LAYSFIFTLILQHPINILSVFRIAQDTFLNFISYTSILYDFDSYHNRSLYASIVDRNLNIFERSENHRKKNVS